MSQRLQFGLRKLLLWTAVAAILLGFLRMLGLARVGLVLAACWMVAVIIAAGAVSLKAACRLSGLAGAVVVAWIAYREAPHGFGGGALLASAALGWILGYTGALLMNGLWSAVDRADNLMQTKKDGAGRRD